MQIPFIRSSIRVSWPLGPRGPKSLPREKEQNNSFFVIILKPWSPRGPKSLPREKRRKNICFIGFNITHKKLLLITIVRKQNYYYLLLLKLLGYGTDFRPPIGPNILLFIIIVGFRLRE